MDGTEGEKAIIHDGRLNCPTSPQSSTQHKRYHHKNWLNLLIENGSIAHNDVMKCFAGNELSLILFSVARGCSTRVILHVFRF
jgi:hypothetical protein